jgi:hypothetical protein
MTEFDGSQETPKPMKARDIWPELKKLLNLPDDAVKAIRIDIEIGGLVEVEVRKYAVAPPSFRSTAAPVTKPATAEESSA